MNALRRVFSPFRRFFSRITGVSTLFAGVTLAPSDVEPRQEVRKRFTEAVEALASGVEAREVNAVVRLESFLVDEYNSLHDELHRVVCANLSLPHSPAVARRLVPLFEKSLRKRLAHAADVGEGLDLNFTHCRLHRVNLSDLDLTEADFAFSDITAGNFEGATLFRARGIEVVIERCRFRNADLGEIRFHGAHAAGALFHEARLVSAKLRDADLRGVDFARAELQGANFDRADLSDAMFSEAKLADARFPASVFNETSLRSLARNPTWRDAHFDEATHRRLDRLSR